MTVAVFLKLPAHLKSYLHLLAGRKPFCSLLLFIDVSTVNSSLCPSQCSAVSVQDYLVLLPQNYYEASVLQDRVNRPCTVNQNGGLCKHFTYVDIATFPACKGEDGYVDEGGKRDRTQLFPDRDIAQELGTSNMALLDLYQVRENMKTRETERRKDHLFTVLVSLF